MKNRVAYFGVFTALALIFSYVETLIPYQFRNPGVKLGLANLVIVIALYKMKLTEGISVVCGQSTTVRIHIWKLFQYHLQPGRWIVKSDGNGTLEEEEQKDSV